MKLICSWNLLKHHGVKGMKCGIRRYQNKDGSLTAAGKERQVYRRRATSANKTMRAVNEIINSMNSEEQYKILSGDSEYLSIEQGSAVVKRILKKYGQIPIAFFDMLDDGNTINVIVGVRSGQYRGKGYGSEVVMKGMEWLDKHKDLVPNKEKVVWGVRTDNTGSIKLAKKNGFTLEKDSRYKDKLGYEWVSYSKPIIRD